MPVALTYPGVYVQELPSSVHTIVGVPTSVAAFVGAAPRGTPNAAVQIFSFADYQRIFGDLDLSFPMSWAVNLFFINGGATAHVVRSGSGGTQASIDVDGAFTLKAASAGSWGDALAVAVNSERLTAADAASKFNLVIGGPSALPQETYVGLTSDEDTLSAALRRSRLVALDAVATPSKRPADKGYAPAAPAGGGGAAGGGAAGGGAAGGGAAGGGAAGGAAAGGGAAGAGAAPAAAGPDPVFSTQDAIDNAIAALAKVDIFNMLCLPVDPTATFTAAQLDAALEFCSKHRAMLIVDPPSSWSSPQLDTGSGFTTASGNPAFNAGAEPAANAATYFPNLIVTDRTGKTAPVGPSGAVAGVWAATDTSRGVWKAPAGTQAGLAGITDLAAHIDEDLSGILNPIGINGLRTLPLFGNVVWGARTGKGADVVADQWKYLPVRRTALFIEESLRRSTQWVVFEPNAEPLWSSLRLNVGVFMNGLWRQGAFAGTTKDEAYFVKCDKVVNPQDQVDLGIVNILVGFAPLKPAEFVVISIEQLAGQLQT